ncbi:MAG: TIGR04372 family glycosyltransferase [Nanoarchaeota archaeon]|nr:TIGR04372 family glycosyltransferase [Nanoarchaeota archaeon]
MTYVMIGGKIKFLIVLFFNLFTVPIIFFYFILDIFIKIRFVCIMDDRIGHLAGSTELFLRRINLDIISRKKTRFIGVASNNPPNKQLMKMFKRKLNIVHLPRKLWYFFRIICCDRKSFMRKLGFFQFVHIENNNYFEFDNGEASLNFTLAEEEKGEDSLRNMGLKGKDWFICFHARDPSYLKKTSQLDHGYNCHRDCKISNYIPAANYIIKEGGFSIRMGAVVDNALNGSLSERIIDYATKFRSDFGDIFLCSHCKFYLGNSAGLFLVAGIFNIPIAYANLIPMDCIPVRKTDLFIPKKIWSKKEKRYLKFNEIVCSDVCSFVKDEQYNEAGLIPIENTSKEILDLAIEMNERLDGTWKTTKEDEELQQKFKSLFKKGSFCYGFPSRIGTKFLRENKALLEY